MIRRLAALGFLLAASNAIAAPVTLTCHTLGPVAQAYGDLTVIVDESERAVEIARAEKQVGYHAIYRDGAISPVNVGAMQVWPYAEPVEQFVIVGPTQIFVGWRNESGGWGHAAAINRSALRANGPPCRWRSYRGIAAG